MIPILYSVSETSFTSEGLGRFAEAVSCKVVEERNGKYELTMVYPANGVLFSQIDTGMFIFAKPNDTANPQAFRIYKISTPLNGRVTINAQHISYDLSGIPVIPFSATGITATLNGIKNNSAIANDFTFWTDVTNTDTKFELTVPASARSCLGGMEGSVLDMFSGPGFGEYEWDMKTVKFYGHRGTNNGVRIAYGKNMTDLNKEKSEEMLYTGVMAYWTDSGSGTVVRSAIQYVANHASYPVEKIYLMDATSDFESKPTVTQLNNRAITYRDANNVGVPRVNVKVSFVPLWQSEEYKNLAPLERISLCDTVTVYYDRYGVDATAEVIETDYDVLKERYNSITLGDTKSRLDETIQNKINETVTTQAQKTTSFLEQAIENATNLITGGDGGYVVISQDADGKPYEILIMDNEDKTQATNVIRMNQNGIGFSTTGYNGPFTTAWTIDGGFVADFIKSGTISAIDINGSTVTGSIINFGTSATKVVAQTANYIVDASEATEGVKFSGTGGFGVEAKVVEIDAGYGGGHLWSSSSTYTEAHMSVGASRKLPTSNVSRVASISMQTSLSTVKIRGAIDGTTSGDTEAVIDLIGNGGYITVSATNKISIIATNSTINISAGGRIDVSSPTGVVVDSEKWAYLGHYVPNSGTYFSAGQEDSRVYVRTDGVGHYVKWGTINGTTCLVQG